MTLTVDDQEADRLARGIAALTGETLTHAIRTALAERPDRERHRRHRNTLLATQLLEIGRHCAALPDLDPLTPDEIGADNSASGYYAVQSMDFGGKAVTPQPSTSDIASSTNLQPASRAIRFRRR